jgi:hypothetical protein
MRHPEERFEPRLAVDFPVQVVRREGHDVSQARNLSSGGVQLQRGFEELRLGEDVEIALRLPEAQGPISCRATVVYERGLVAGLCFSHLPPAEQERIDEFIRAQLASRR